MISKSTGKEIVINDVDLDFVFDEEKRLEVGFCLNWDSNIGFGQMTFIKKGIDGHATLNVETECMSDNGDKEFIKLVLDKFIEKLNVIE